LKNSDFLDVEHFPAITFRSDRVTLAGPLDANVSGDITIHRAGS